MMWGYADGWGWNMLFGMMWMVVFWGALIGLVVWGVNRLSTRGPAGETPLDIVQKRLARGEITREQYEELKRALA